MESSLSRLFFPEAQGFMVRFRALNDLYLPPFFGPTFRGAFGFALKNLACSLRRMKSCAECIVLFKCPYAILFETPATIIIDKAEQSPSVTSNAPHPLAMAPVSPSPRKSGNAIKVLAGEDIKIRFALIGEKAFGLLPYIVLALKRAGENGIGARADIEEDKSGGYSKDWNDESLTERGEGRARNRGRADLIDIVIESPSGDIEGQLVYDKRTEQIKLPDLPEFNSNARDVKEVTIEFITPVRVKESGSVTSRIDLATLAKSLGRRVKELSLYFGDQTLLPDLSKILNGAALVKIKSSDLRIFHVKRFSNRQGRHMSLPGMVGKITFEGEGIKALDPLLRYGSIVQVGKNTMFGFGYYKLS